jgi:diguanylate cyclase (GGDEF)-like protein
MALLGASVIAIAIADYLTGPDIGLSLFYLVPIVIAGRQSGRTVAVTLAVAAASGWQFADAAWRGVTAVSIWNGATRLGIFLGAAFLMSRLRDDERRLGELNRQLEAGLALEQRLARTDALTSLANGRMFRDEVQRTLARARRDGEPVTIAYLDLDNFKALNDRYGHAEGDEILKDVASGIAAVIREGDLAARLGGDEFALLLHGCSQDALEAIGARLLTQVKTVASRYPDVRFGATIGFAECTPPASDPDAAIRAADRAMYAAKFKGKNRIEIVTAT